MVERAEPMESDRKLEQFISLVRGITPSKRPISEVFDALINSGQVPLSEENNISHAIATLITRGEARISGEAEIELVAHTEKIGSSL